MRALLAVLLVTQCLAGCFLQRGGRATGECMSATECDTNETCVDGRCVRQIDAGTDSAIRDGGADGGHDAETDAGIDGGADAGTDAGIGGVSLLDYSTADTFVRTTEAAFVDPRPIENGGTGSYAWDFVGGDLASNWKAPDTRRIFSDGAVLIEGARTNLVLYSENLAHAAWSRDGPAPTVAGAAPDGDGDALLIDNDGTAPDRYYIGYTPPPIGVGVSHSAYARGVGGTKLGSRKGAYGLRTFHTPLSTSTYRRVIDTYATPAGPNYSLWTAHNNDDATGVGVAGETVRLWGIQVEVGDFSTSPIRTAGAAATRNADQLYWGSMTAAQEAALGRPGGWHIDVWPNYSSTEVHALNAAVLTVGPSLLSVVNVGTSGNDWSLTVGTGTATCAGVAFSRGDHLRIHVISQNANATISIRVENLTTATDSTAGTASGSASTWVGQRLTIGNLDGGTTAPIDAVVGEPEAE